MIDACQRGAAQLPPPEIFAHEEREGGDAHASDEEPWSALIRLYPGDPRRCEGEQENGGDHGEQQRANVHAESAPTSRRLLGGMFAPVVGDQAWRPPDVSE